MKGIVIFFLASLFLVSGCEKTDIMNEPVSAQNFQEFTKKLEKICYKTDNATCGYINGPIDFYLPKSTSNELLSDEKKQEVAQNIYKKLNNKTPNEIIEIYKGILLVDLEKSRGRDTEIIQNLDEIKNVHEKTKHFATDIFISHVSVDFRKQNMPTLNFEITNKTKFNVKQIVAEAEFYTTSETFLGREKAFSHVFKPTLGPNQTISVAKKLSSIPEQDMTLIKAAKNLKIRVLISSLQTGSKKENESIIILALPYSYYKMRELIEESDKLYNDTVNKIKDINIKK